MLCTTSWSLEQFGWYSCGFWNLENGPLNCLLYGIFMHQSMFSPREGRPGIQYLGYLTQCLLLWVGNRKRFDKTQNPKGGDIWQCHERAWKLQPSTKVLGRLLLFTSFSTSSSQTPSPSRLDQCSAKHLNTDGTDWKCPFCVIGDLMWEVKKFILWQYNYGCICM